MPKAYKPRLIDLRPMGGSALGGTWPSALGSLQHTILGELHTDADHADIPALHDLLHWDGTHWDAMSLWGLIILLGGVMIGRQEGAHIWLRVKREGDPPDQTPAPLPGDVLILEATNHDGVPIWSYDYTLDETNSAHMRIGMAGRPQITLETPTGAAGDPEQPVGVVIPVDGLDRLIINTDIDLDDLAEHFYLAHDTTMPDAQGYPAGNLRLMQSPGDPNLFILWVRDHLDNWQLIGGAGYAFPHSHTSEETGGLITAGALPTRWEPLANGDPTNPALVFDATGDVIMCEVAA